MQQKSEDAELSKTAVNLSRESNISDDLSYEVSLCAVPLRSVIGHETAAAALLDDGEQGSFVSKDLANKLDLPGFRVKSCTEGTEGHVTEHETITTRVFVSPYTRAQRCSRRLGGAPGQGDG